jgi:hypothetical protein
MFQKELYNGITNVIVWRVLRKRLRFKGVQTIHRSTPSVMGSLKAKADLHAIISSLPFALRGVAYAGILHKSIAFATS